MKLSAVALWLAVTATLAIGAPALLQDRLLYYPQRAALAELTQGGLDAWPSAQEFRGLVAQPEGAARATVIVFHGNAGHAGHRSYYAVALTRLGVRAILAEYPGYGPRGGEVGEASLVDAAARDIELAHKQFGSPLLVVGESLGAGVAAAAAARRREQVAALMLITPWDKLESVASYHYPWLPVRWLLRDRYDSVTHLAAFGRPVLVVVAGQDDIVPAHFGQALYDALPAPKRLLRLPGAGHNDWSGRIDAAWWQRSLDFLLAAPPR